MKHADIHSELARIASQVAQLEAGGFDEEVVDEAREKLSELKAASRPVLAHGEELLSGLVARNVEVWRNYKTKLKQVSSFLDVLL